MNHKTHTSIFIDVVSISTLLHIPPSSILGGKSPNPNVSWLSFPISPRIENSGNSHSFTVLLILVSNVFSPRMARSLLAWDSDEYCSESRRVLSLLLRTHEMKRGNVGNVQQRSTVANSAAAHMPVGATL